jgi:hypothetical protein
MVRIIQWLVFGHYHVWKVIHVAEPKRGPIVYHQMCERCGKLRFTWRLGDQVSAAQPEVTR